MVKKDFRFYMKRTWKFIWEDDSIWSWMVNIVLAFILIKFIVYPGLGFILQTSHPIVAVVSISMEHDGSFDDWWGSMANCGSGPCTQAEYYNEIGITRQDFLDFNFKNGFNMGDIMILYGVKPEKVEVGNVIVFRSTKIDPTTNQLRKDPIIHRVIKIIEKNGTIHYTTKGDHNKGIYYNIGEDDIRDEMMIGKAVFRIPYLGWIKIMFVKLLNIAGWL